MGAVPERSSAKSGAVEKFLQQEAHGASKDAVAGWSDEDTALVRKALKSANVFMQQKHMQGYYPSYAAKSGEIVGILKQLKEEMEGELGEAQKREVERAATFEQMRSAKSAEIAAGEKM